MLLEIHFAPFIVVDGVEVGCDQDGALGQLGCPSLHVNDPGDLSLANPKSFAEIGTRCPKRSSHPYLRYADI